MLRHVIFGVVLVCGGAEANAQKPAKIDFARDVRPLFKARCIECHGPAQQKNGFRLDRRRDAMKGGTGTMIGRGSAAASRLYLKLIGNSVGTQMPPDGPLDKKQIAIIKAWIDQGAVWPDKDSGETPSPPPDPQASRMMELLRSGDRAAFLKLLRTGPKAVKAKGPGGTTPLMYAVLYADAETVRLILDAGADPNVRNEAGATALMWAVDDADKTRLLLRRGANVNARSEDGWTPLLIATTWCKSFEVVKLLLDRGAKPSVVVTSYRGPLTPLRLAAEAADDAVLRLLLARGADAKAMGGVLPLVAAANAEDRHCVELLINTAHPMALKPASLFLVPPFSSPRTMNHPRIWKRVIAKGADVRQRDESGRSVLSLAVVSDTVTAETVRELIKLGADVNSTDKDGTTVLDYARRRGQTPIVSLLVKAGAKPGRQPVVPNAKPKRAASVRAAIARSLPLLQRADVTFFRKSACLSCHNNSLTAMTRAAARKVGIRVDEQAVRKQRKEIGAYLEAWRDRSLLGMGIPGDSNAINYILVGLAAENYPADPATDALARFLKNDQKRDGHWRLIANRPPLGSSEFEMTAVAMRALQVYAPKTRRADYQKAVWRAADWLRSTKPATTADRAFQLIGLTWAGDSKESLVKAARKLLAEQRADGGWGQLRTMKSDAYATGQVLVALHRAGTLAVTDAVYRRGVEFLMSTQLEDGSWHVRSRAIPFQPYFESGFPHGPDQWISAAATNWAVMALIPAVKSTARRVR